MAARQRADQLLVERGLSPSRERARALILAGKVFAGEARVEKAGQLLPEDAGLRLDEPDHPYVGRGGLKLRAALDAFGIAVEGRSAVDVGASTGGFTDCLLRAGARRVYAVDVGTNQLDWRLRNDERVVVLEGLHVRDLEADHLDPRVDLATVDVSFIGLTKALPHVARIESLREAVVLVKPNFELEREQVGKGGVVRDPAARALAVDRVRQAAAELGFETRGEIESPVRGATKGNVEFLLHLTRGGAPDRTAEREGERP